MEDKIFERYNHPDDHGGGSHRPNFFGTPLSKLVFVLEQTKFGRVIATLS